jgi:hypothetical protein
VEQNNDNSSGQEPNVPSQVPAQSNNTSETHQELPPQGGGLSYPPTQSDDTVRTAGGAYIAGPIATEGGVSIYGGTVGTVIYGGSTPTSSVSPNRPENYVPFERNPLFQARPGEFEELERLLFEVETAHKRLGLVGMGGVGKTQLAVELVYHCLDEERFPDGVFWLIATGNADDWRVALAKLALTTNYLPLDDKPSDADNELRRAQHLCRYLASHSRALLVLDNADDPGLILSVLPALAGGEITCSLLYSSRVARVLPGFTAYSVDKLPQETALRLLLAFTRPVLLAEILWGSQDEEARAARVLCEMVGYLPLALVHLRAVLNDDQDILLTALLAALREQGALEVANDLDPDAAPLIATFHLSWEKVKEVEAQRLFKLAAFFPKAAPIPLGLLGLAAGLGEKTEGFTRLGKMLLRLQQLRLLESVMNFW